MDQVMSGELVARLASSRNCRGDQGATVENHGLAMACRIRRSAWTCPAALDITSARARTFTKTVNISTVSAVVLAAMGIHSR